MSNQYYNRQTECNPGELADGLAIEAEFDSLGRAFDKLPDPHRDGGGFEGPVKVGAAVEGDEAAQLAQINALLEGFLSKAGNLAGLEAPDTALGNLGITNVGKGVAKAIDAAAGRTALGLSAIATAAFGIASGNVAAGDLTSQGVNSSCTGHIASGMSADSIVRSGDYSIDPSATNNPWPGTWSNIHHVEHVQQNGYAWQIGSPVSNLGLLRMRKKHGNTWYPWVPVHTNDSLPYEVGTFTPIVFGAAVAGVTTYTNQLGKYTRIGNRVFFMIYVSWTAASGTGDLRIGGFPFTNAGSSPEQFSIIPENLTFSGQLVAGMGSGTNYATPMTVASGVNWAPVSMDAAAGIRLSGSYQIL